MKRLIKFNSKDFTHRTWVIAFFAVILLSSCATAYHADFSKPQGPDEQINPYQQPVPTDGVASFIGDIIRR